MKTGDPQGPWVRIPPSPPFTTESPFTNFALEKYSRGRRGAPAKGVGRETGARVQIPPSPPRRRKRYIACGDSFCKNRRALILLRLLFPTKLCFANFCGGPGWAPHESAGLFTLFAGIWTRAPKGAGKKSDRRLRRMQGGFFGAAVGKAEAAAPADGRAGHRKRGRAFRPGRTALQALETEPASRPAAAAGAARIFWRSGRQGRGGCARRRPRRAPQEGPRFPSRPHFPAGAEHLLSPPVFGGIAAAAGME